MKIQQLIKTNPSKLKGIKKPFKNKEIAKQTIFFVDQKTIVIKKNFKYSILMKIC